MAMMRRAVRVAAAAAAFLPAVAGAQEITYQGELSGTGAGLGAVLTVLTLNNTRDVSSGCITPTGTEGCGFANNVVQESSTTRLISEIGGLTSTLGTGLRIVVNFSEPAGNPAQVDQLQLQLFDALGAVAYTGDLGSPVAFESSQTGVGNVGFAFGLTAAAAADFQAVLDGLGSLTDVRIGLGASLSDVQGGLDTFSLVRVDGGGTGSVVPEPGTWALLGTGLLGLAGIARRRRAS